MMRGLLDRAFGIDLRSLAAFRIVLGCILMLDLLMRARWVEAHYTDAGVLPLATLYQHYWGVTHWSVHALSPDAGLQIGLMVLQGLFTVGMIVGFKTRISVLGVWFLLASLGTRNQLILQGGDDLLRMLVFWSIFLPMGARWSVDARGREGDPPDRVLSVASFALLLQVVYMYWCTAYLKWSPVWWEQGAAVEMTLRLDVYATPMGKLMLLVPPLLPLLTWATLVWEYLGPLLALLPLKSGRVRTFTVFAFFFMHLGFGASIEIGAFWMTSMACWIPFLPAYFWELVPRRLPQFPSLKTLRGKGTLHGESPVLGVLVVALFAYVTLWNLRTLDGRANYQNMLKVFPTVYNPIGYALRLDQYWSMFAPAPPSRDGWYVVPATLTDGTEVDLYSMRDEVSWDRPPNVMMSYDSQRWRKFLYNLPEAKHASLRPGYAQWLKRRWERAHPGGPAVQELELVLMVETTLTHGEAPLRKQSLGTFRYED